MGANSGGPPKNKNWKNNQPLFLAHGQFGSNGTDDDDDDYDEFAPNITKPNTQTNTVQQKAGRRGRHVCVGVFYTSFFCVDPPDGGCSSKGSAWSGSPGGG